MRMLTPALALLSIAFAAGAQDDPAKLAAAAGCNSCHRPEQTMAGPSWQAIAERYRGQEDAAATIKERMRAGSQGVWGKTPMPPVTAEQLTDAELGTVTDWILSR